MICPKCGFKSETNIKFCPSCGAEMVEKVSEKEINKIMAINEAKDVDESKAAAIYEFTCPKEKIVKDIRKGISMCLGHLLKKDTGSQILLGSKWAGWLTVNFTDNKIIILRKHIWWNIISSKITLKPYFNQLCSMIQSIDDVRRIK